MAAQFEAIKQSVDKALHDKSRPWTQGFEFLEQKTGVGRINLMAGTSVLVAVYLVFGYGAQLLCNVIGVVYPAYVSIHAIESSTKLDDTKWLIYWVTFAMLSIIEHFSFIMTSVIPMYWLLKCIFLIWCMLPIDTNGSVIIYQRVVRPYFLKHHAAADKVLDNMFDKAKQSVSNVLSNEKME